MSMDTSALPFSKGRPVALVRADRRSALKAHDDKESAKVKMRSGGRCEVNELQPPLLRLWLRCQRRACEVNHLLGGRGVRGRGESAKAIRKIYMCKPCHSDYHAHILRRVGSVVPLWSDPYTRVR